MLFGGDEWTIDQVDTARRRLAGAVSQGCAAFALLHRGDACDQAAATSLEDILNQEADSWKTARAIRQSARQAHECQLADDSLRKREQPVMDLVAHTFFRGLTEQQTELLPSRDSIMRVLRPYAELAGLSVEAAAKLFSQRAALDDDITLYRAVAAATWAVAQFGVLPVYGLQRLEAMGIRDLTDEAIEYLLSALIKVPFVDEPDDLNQLATATQLGEEPDTFYDRLIQTPVMRPVLERFVVWLSTHDPKVCLADSNDVIIGYCGPHYYAAMCESFVQAADDYSSGAFTRDIESMLEATALGERARRRVRADEGSP